MSSQPSPIARVLGREILDSRGNPTVEVDVILADGTIGAGGGTIRSQHGHLRGGRAARWRQEALPRQRRHQGRRQRQLGAGQGRRGTRSGRPGRVGPRADRGRRHAEQRQAGRQRHPGREPGRRQGGRRGPRLAALPLHRRCQRPRSPGADGQYHQRRQTRRQQDRFPGIHGHARRRQVVRRGHPHGRRGLSHAQGGLEKGRPQHQRRRRRGIRPQPRQRGSHQVHPRGRRQGRVQGRPRPRHRDRARYGLLGALRRGGEERATSSGNRPRKDLLAASK